MLLMWLVGSTFGMEKDEEKLISFFLVRKYIIEGGKKEKRREEITIFHLPSLPLSFTS